MKTVYLANLIVSKNNKRLNPIDIPVITINSLRLYDQVAGLLINPILAFVPCETPDNDTIQELVEVVMGLTADTIERWEYEQKHPLESSMLEVTIGDFKFSATVEYSYSMESHAAKLPQTSTHTLLMESDLTGRIVLENIVDIEDLRGRLNIYDVTNAALHATISAKSPDWRTYHDELYRAFKDITQTVSWWFLPNVELAVFAPVLKRNKVEKFSFFVSTNPSQISQVGFTFIREGK